MSKGSSDNRLNTEFISNFKEEEVLGLDPLSNKGVSRRSDQSISLGKWDRSDQGEDVR